MSRFVNGVLVFASCFGAMAASGCRQSVLSDQGESKLSFVQEGIRVDLGVDSGRRSTITPGSQVELRFTVSEAGEDGGKLSGLFPLAWLVNRKEGEEAPDRKGCDKMIRSLLAGRLARVADVNLNEYYLVTLDDNNSISLIDPQIESSKTKTLGMVTLTSKGVDFVLAPDRRTVLVTLVAGGKVAAADINRMIARYVDVGGRPRRVTLSPDGRYAWIGDFERSAVTAIDLQSGDLQVVGPIETGAGPHEFAMRFDSRYTFVTSPNSTTVDVIDTQKMERVSQVEVGDGVVGVLASRSARKIYAARKNGQIIVIDDTTFTAEVAITIASHIDKFALSPDGRWAFALDTERARLFILDTATNKIAYEAPTAEKPDAIDFTESFAYVRHASSGNYILVDLTTLGTGQLPGVNEIVMGQRPPAEGQAGLVATTLAGLPEGGGALLLNPADRLIYHFMEGMAAPMGSYQTYPWPVKGVLLADRTLQETDKGIYRTDFRAPRSGTYTVPFLVPTSPQLTGCFEIEVAGLMDTKVEYPLNLENATTEMTLGDARFRVRVIDSKTKAPIEGLTDVNLLAMSGPSWSFRGLADDVGDGYYEAVIPFPSAGKYRIMTQVPSKKAMFARMPSTFVEVIAPVKGDRER